LVTCSKAKGESKGHTPDKFSFDGAETMCECGAPMEPKRDKYCSYRYAAGEVAFGVIDGPHKKTRMRNNIDSKLQTTKKDGGLYSYKEIIEGQTFSGTIKFASEEIFKLWESVIFKGASETDASFGRGRSRGLGAGRLRYKRIEKDSGFSFPVEKRAIGEDGRCAVMFISDAVLLDEYLAPASRVPADYLKSICPGVEFEMDEVNTMLNYKVKRGFNAHKGLPAIPEAVVAPGSVFVIKFKDFASNKEKIFDFLNKLEFYGIGERTGEGFGRLAVAPFGIKTQIKISSEKRDAAGIKPDAVRSLLSGIEMSIRRRLEAFIKDNLYSLDQLPSMSSIKNLANNIKPDPNGSTARKIIKDASEKRTAIEKWCLNIWLPGKKTQTTFIDFIKDEELTGNDERAHKTMFWLAKLLNENKKSKKI
nr:hypothetical protein [Candidatus Wallbacteria bacterium]